MSKYKFIVLLVLVILIYLSYLAIRRYNSPKVSSSIRNRFVVGPSKKLPVYPLTSSVSQSVDDITTSYGSPQRLYMLFNDREGKSLAHNYEIKSKLINRMDVVDVGAMYEDEEKAFALVILYKQDRICIVSNYGSENSSYKLVENNVKKIKQITTLGKRLYGLTTDGKLYFLSSRTFQWRLTNVERNGNISWICANTTNMVIEDRLYQETTDDKGKITLSFVSNLNVPHAHNRYIGKTSYDYADLNTITGQAKIYINGILSHTYQHVQDLTFGNTVLIVQRGDSNFVKTKFLFGEQMLISRQTERETNTTLTNSSIRIE
jgi:hypothetical protein